MRSAAPASYPCFKESGFFKPTDTCRERCCVVPAKTPDGEDSPKWSATVAARMEHEVAIAQPDFGSAKSPGSSSKRARTPSSYASSSSFSPSEDPAGAAFFGKKRLRIMYGQNPDNYTPGAARASRRSKPAGRSQMCFATVRRADEM